MNGPFTGFKHYSLLTDGAEYGSDVPKLQEDLASCVWLKSYELNICLDSEMEQTGQKFLQ